MYMLIVILLLESASLLHFYGRGKVCVYSTLPRPHLWDYIGYVVVDDDSDRDTSQNWIAFSDFELSMYNLSSVQLSFNRCHGDFGIPIFSLNFSVALKKWFLVVFVNFKV